MLIYIKNGYLFKVTDFTLHEIVSHYEVNSFHDPLRDRDSRFENTGVDDAVWEAQSGVK
jgi:hypothetical protein